MKPLFEYFDYQEFLRDYYEHKKTKNPAFSYRYIGSKLGLDPGFLVKVFQGKMHLSNKSIQSVVSFCKFNKREASYFETLVYYGKAKNKSDVKHHFEKLLTLRNLGLKIIEPHQYAFYQKWYYSAIYFMLSYFSFADNYKKLAMALDPPISVKDAKEAVHLLVQLGMISRQENGTYCQVNRHISTGEKWHSSAIHTFQQETIRLASEALDRHPKSDRDISTVSIAISHEDVMELRERIKEFRRQILSITNENKADCVYQINVQAFPLTVLPPSNKEPA